MPRHFDRDNGARWSAEKSAAKDSSSFSRQPLKTSPTSNNSPTPRLRKPANTVAFVSSLITAHVTRLIVIACILCLSPTRKTRPSASTR
jgi:hypothetical protein